MIIEQSRDTLKFQHGDRVVTVYCEWSPRPVIPNYILYKRSLQKWDPPFDHEPIDDATREQIIAQITAELAERGATVRVEW